MRKKVFFAAIIFALVLFLLPACEIKSNESIKALTAPHITQYECTEARLGNADFLDHFDYIRITLLDKKQLEISYKYKNGKKHSYTSDYTFDAETRELSTETGILGIKQIEKVTIENGKFTITKKLGLYQLVLNFQSK